MIGLAVLESPLSKVFPGLYSVSRPITTPDVPVIVAASMLTAYDAPMLPLTRVGSQQPVEKNGVRLYQAVGSYPIISLFLETKPSDYYKVLWNSCSTTTVWIGSMGYEEPLDKLLSIFALTGFGDARVDVEGSPPALLTLNEVVSLYRDRKLNCSLPVKDVASDAIFIDPDAMLLDALHLMREKRIRRLFLRGRKGEFVSDRSILGLLFSPRGLKAARDSPGLMDRLQGLRHGVDKGAPCLPGRDGRGRREPGRARKRRLHALGLVFLGHEVGPGDEAVESRKAQP